MKIDDMTEIDVTLRRIVTHDLRPFIGDTDLLRRFVYDITSYSNNI